MSRISLFERIQQRGLDLTKEYLKLDTIIRLENEHAYTIEQLFELHFREWDNKGNYLSLQELRDELGLNMENFSFGSMTNRRISEDQFFLYCELIANLGLAFSYQLDQHFLYEKYSVVLSTIRLDIEKMNYTFKELASGQVIITEINPAATVVSEIVEPDLSDKIIEYNHYLLRGDLTKKREILRALSHKYDAAKPTLKSINSGLEDRASFLLNNLNIRHNNKDKQSKDYKKFVADMSDSDLEHWYDETYQTLLFALLSVDQVSRNRAIDELKAKITTTK